MCAWGLNEWGDVANIIIAVVSVATAIVTAIVLCKQHKLQQKQHELEKEKLNAQQLEHQPKFYFKRYEDRLEICNNGDKLAQPIYFAIRSIIYVQSTMFNGKKLQDYVYCFPLNIYNDCRSSEELEGVVATCKFNKEDRIKLHEQTTNIWNALVQNYGGMKVPKMYNMASLIIRESDLTIIKYVDIYQKEHILYYYDSIPIEKDVFDMLNKIADSSKQPMANINNINIRLVIQGILQCKYPKTW